MLPLMDLVMKAGGGQSPDLIANRLGITREQTERAMEALMPAFSASLKRNVHDPMGMANFLQALQGGRHADYFDRPEAATTDSGMMEGNAILGHLFGSRELSRAVAAQASQLSGLSESVLKQMLPMLAPIVLGGLFKQMSGQGPGGGRSPARGPFDMFLEHMMGGGGSRGRAQPGNPWIEMFEKMAGGGNDRANPAGDNPLGRIFEEMMGAGPDRGERGSPAPRAGKPEPDRPTGGLGDLFGEMFEAGRNTQRDYQRGMESIFEEFLDGMKRR